MHGIGHMVNNGGTRLLLGIGALDWSTLGFLFSENKIVQGSGMDATEDLKKISITSRFHAIRSMTR